MQCPSGKAGFERAFGRNGLAEKEDVFGWTG